MGDLTAKCDWHDSTLSIVLPDDPERIAVRLFDSRHAPARMYVPEVDALQLQAENAKLRELVARLIRHIENPPCESCMAEMSCAGGEGLTNCDEYQFMVCDARELGVDA